MEFAVHGDYRIEIDKNIIIVAAKGPYNEVVIRDYNVAYKQAIAYVKESYLQWHQIIDMQNNDLFTPDAETELIKLNEYKKEKGLVNNALVYESQYGQMNLKSQMQRIYDKSDLNVEFFHDLDSAKAWLLSQIAD